MARTYGPNGEMKKRKKGEPFNSKSQTKSRMKASLFPLQGTDRRFPYEGPGSLLDKNLEDRDKPRRGYPSDREFPSGTFPLAKKKKKSKKRTA